MFKKSFFRVINTFLIMSFALSSPISLSAQEVYGKETLVQDIEIEMITHKESSDLQPGLILMTMKTKKGEPFSQDVFDKDLKFLSQKYDRVDPKLDFKGAKVGIKLKIWPKKLLREVKFEGNERIKSDKLRKQLEVKNETIFDRTEFNKEFRKLRIYYLKQGFYASNLSFIVEEVPGVDEVRVVIKVEEGKPGRVASIAVTGTTTEEEEDVLDLLYTKTYCFLTSWATGSGLYQQEAIDQDILKTVNYFQNLGYADVKIDIKIEDVPEKKEKIKVTIVVQKGDQYRVKEVGFTGNELYSDAVVKSLLVVEAKGVYSPQQVYKTAEKIRHLYGKKGYIDCAVSQAVELDSEERLFSVHFTIKEGSPYRVGLVKVFGNDRTKTSVILHETLINPGELFDIRKIEATENLLNAMDYFKTVNVYTVEGDSSFGANFRDVHIEVEEKGTGKFGVFGAYSQHEKLVGGFSAQENNFDILGFSKIPKEGVRALRGGGEQFYSKLSMGTRDRQTTVAWAKPHFLDTSWTLKVEGDYHFSKVTKEQESRSRNLALYGIYNVNSFLRTEIYYKINETKFDTKLNTSRLGVKRFDKSYHTMAETEAWSSPLLGEIRETLREENLALDVDKRKTAAEIEKMVKADYASQSYDRFMEPLKKIIRDDAAKGEGVTSAIGLGLTYDSTNHPTKATRGLLSRLTGEFAGIGGDHRFFKLNYENTLYFDITEKLIVKNRLDLHFVSPQRSDGYIPASERLFLGGEYSIRGYNTAAIGPRYTSTSPGGAEIISRLTKGGLSSVLISTELDYRLNQYLVPFVFLDVGDVSAKEFTISPLSKFKASYGLGTQLNIMPGMPPIALGWGFPVKPKYREDEVGTFFFSIGIHF
ncbi:hypothetical protein AB751O23_AC_00040 [Chlamydiales bacterium SCGC AB-751-O23]|jgi:outer membrane protein insertion porin family|nr:hypothetical protein AB751O23_AC_00040 [Chlamydiales bacterium SCGC AB-751-O23]